MSIESLKDAQPNGRSIAGPLRFAYDAKGSLKASFVATDPDIRKHGPGASAGQPPEPGPQAVLDKLGRVTRDTRFRYAYSARGQLESVSELQHGRPVADYAYNYRGQRTRKTVYSGDGQPDTTVFYLWNDQRLVAEVAPDGKVMAQYLSLDDGRGNLPIAKLQSAQGGGQDARRHGSHALMAIHTDHRGAPVAMTDAAQSVVWSAQLTPFGQAEVDSPPGSPELNLRLPGQYLDAETGLHDNWHRTYDPRSGRYLQPDPLGYPDGTDPYVYAGGDPLNHTDPLGLYEIDIHYYMTFFLGVTAGLHPEEARIVALASQYVDNNPLTRPVDDRNFGTTVGSILQNQRQLLSYHFVLSGTDGHTLPEYRNSRLSNADSPQLRNLMNAARSNAIGRNGSLQFLGEYLHALADTYSHRDADNLPYDALIANCGVGHGHALHEPDLTYDDIRVPAGSGEEGQPPAGQTWRREARTLEMELQLHAVLLAYGDPAKARVPQEIEDALREFNAIRESEESGAMSDLRRSASAGLT
jgi:RHS repeat-associated protein